MLKSVIGAADVTEIYEITGEIKRGSLVAKNLTTNKAEKATDVGVDVFLLDADNQPTGHLSDVELSQYLDELDTVSGRGILVSFGVGKQFATDQVEVDGSGNYLVAKGDYAVAGGTGKEGLFAKATTGDTSKFKCLGEYDDAGHALVLFQVVDPVTVA